MTTLLISEGDRDFGRPLFEGDEGDRGPLQALIRRTLGDPDGLVFATRRVGKVHGRGAVPPMPPMAQKVKRALNDAQRDGFDAVIVVVDRDTPSGQTQLQHMRLGREKAGSPLPCALGMAQECVEAWLLGDPEAFQQAFGKACAPIPARPEEELGGRNSARPAKKVLREVLERAQVSDDIETLTRLADHLDPDAVRRRCPRSFAPFADELRTHIAPLYG